MQRKDREPVRTTIVGGQPTVRTKSSLPIPDGIERVIERAAGDTRFRADLIKARAAAARDAGIELTAGEQMLLASVSEAQLTDLIDQATPKPSPRRRFIQAAALVGGAALTGGCKRKKKIAAPTTTRGIQPDIPGPEDEPDDDDDDDEDDDHDDPDDDIDDDDDEDGDDDGDDDDEDEDDDRPQPTRGIRPDIPGPTKGIRPDVPEDL